MLPVFGPFSMKIYICCYGVAINMVSNSLNSGHYVRYKQYDFIRKLCTAHDNVDRASVYGVINSR